MKRILFSLGLLWSLSAVAGPSYAADAGFLSNLKGLLFNVAQRSDLVGGVSYVMNDAPSDVTAPLPPSANEWAGELGATVELNPKMALFSTLELGIDNRILRTKFGVSRHLWGK